MTAHPKISIVTPNYNYGHFLEATLRSVLDQGYPNLEYIVMDDGSTDGSQEIIRRHERRLAHWESGPNRGQYKVITAGFGRSTGEIMGWINSDDMHFPWTLQAVADIFATFPRVEWISTLQLGRWDWTGISNGFDPVAGFDREAFLDGRYNTNGSADPLRIPAKQEWIQQESTFWRRSLWEKAGAYVSSEFGAAGDFELWSRFYRHADLYGVAIPLAGFRQQHQQQTSQYDKYARQCMPALQHYRTQANWRPSRMRRLVYEKSRYVFFLRLWKKAVARYGYIGRKIVRTNINRPQAGWEIEEYRFL